MRRAWLVVFTLCLAACASTAPEASQPSATPVGLLAQRSPFFFDPQLTTPTANVRVVIVSRPQGPTPSPAPPFADALGIQATLGMSIAESNPNDNVDRQAAWAMLKSFADPSGLYQGAWWFADDGRADIYEALAVILFTEGNTNTDVQKAVAARYLWYCGGAATACQGAALLNFLSYFQPWREPWAVPGGISHPAAQSHLAFARELILQKPGLLTDWIPGADRYIHDMNNLYAPSPIDWASTPFHFANVHPTWDAFLRERLRRNPNGSNRLWVLTLGEADRACRTRFICDDMTQPRP
jgi:hypothetical protein